MRRCLACSAAGLGDSRFNERAQRLAGRGALSQLRLGARVLSSASGALEFSGQSLTNFCWAAMADFVRRASRN